MATISFELKDHPGEDSEYVRLLGDRLSAHAQDIMSLGNLSMNELGRLYIQVAQSILNSASVSAQEMRAASSRHFNPMIRVAPDPVDEMDGESEPEGNPDDGDGFLVGFHDRYDGPVDRFSRELEAQPCAVRLRAAFRDNPVQYGPDSYAQAIEGPHPEIWSKQDLWIEKLVSNLPAITEVASLAAELAQKHAVTLVDDLRKWEAGADDGMIRRQQKQAFVTSMEEGFRVYGLSQDKVLRFIDWLRTTGNREGLARLHNALHDMADAFVGPDHVRKAEEATTHLTRVEEIRCEILKSLETGLTNKNLGEYARELSCRIDANILKVMAAKVGRKIVTRKSGNANLYVFAES